MEWPGPTSERAGRYRDASSHVSPLRYPGGKRKLANYLRLLIRRNDLLDGHYAEVYAGGASVALTLLFNEYVDRIHINDIDPGVYAFWLAARDRSDELCARVRAARMDIDEWRRQRAIHGDKDADPLDRGFATFYLNRTNRSGIVTGGPIGGYSQNGEWRLDARFAKEALVARIQKVARHRSRIRVHNLDAADFLANEVPRLPRRTLVYLDPPYFVKGQQLLYANYYQAQDHAEIARLVSGLDRPWVVSYDETPEIASLYSNYRSVRYGISYSAHDRYRGREAMFFADGLSIPDIPSPAGVRTRELARLEAIAGIPFSPAAKRGASTTHS